MKLTWSTSSQAVWVPVTGGPGALLISPFNVPWRFSALAGGVEGSKLCLFSVIMPAKCVSSVSPRFHYRRLKQLRQLNDRKKNISSTQTNVIYFRSF
jgi:hypothetical protein